MIFIIAIPYIIVASSGSNLALPFLAYTAILGTLGIAGLVMIIFGISLLYRSAKNTLTTTLVILLGFSIPALFSSTLKANSVAGFFSRINPVDNIFSSLDNVLVDYQTSLWQNVQYLLPLLIFCVVGLVFLVFVSKRFEKDGVIKND